ncbi:auxin efflux carrier [Leucosporidium creatinivorum]|uniref:Auxin efflux carrier n=1 Tax=Leucosporidium creatinivorum TaxID=106004 RepID=A0A1Y2EXZ1_9BASI|nr:auxin efflux carrier [Leucosporidium creatinivorum]
MSSTATPAINTIIWLSVKPLIKLVISAGAGFFLARSGLFPTAGSRSASQIILNVTLPSLLFSKIIPSFNSENVKAIGPIFLVGIVYMLVSALFGVLIRIALPTPRNFRWGLLASAIWANWGDVPTSIVQSVCLSAPFAGQADADLAVAYVSIFILLFYLTLFPFRGTLLIQRDYTHPPKEVEDEENVSKGRWSRVKAASEHVRSLPGLVRRRKGGREQAEEGEGTSKAEDGEKEGETAASAAEPGSAMHLRSTRSPPTTFSDLQRVTTSRSIGQASVRELAGTAAAASVEDTAEEHQRRASFGRGQLRMALAERERLKTIVGSPAHSVFDDDGADTAVGTSTDVPPSPSRKLPSNSLPPHQLFPNGSHEEPPFLEEEVAPPRPLPLRILLGVKEFALSLLTPPTISLVTALVCALVTKLKALFVFVDGSSFNPTAPDGDPPLAIILDTASFLGAASVPLGLLVLGSALARMRLPRPLTKLPLASIASLAVCKLIVLPIVGFLMVQGLTSHTNLVDEENRVLRFVLIYFSCVPTATTQVALAQIFAPEDGESNSDTLASYIVFQYIIFVFSSVVLTAVTLSNIF